jgi:cyclophilin family peptidyl-prolyl cis-trans isomerase/HEAT repeat protein
MKTNRIFLRSALPALLLLITVGIALGQGPAPTKTLADIAILEDQRSVDTARVGQWIINDDPEIRSRTAYTIGIIGDALYRPFLLRLLDDSARQVRLQAIFAAGQLGDSTYTEWLLRYSADGDSTIKSRAIEALSKVVSLATTKQLMAILGDSLEKPHFRALAAESIHRLRDRYSFGALVAQATNPDVTIREKVFFSLSRRANREALSFYLSGLKDSNRQIRLYALTALTRVGDVSVLPEIKPLLRENDWRTKYYALGVVDKVRGRDLLSDVATLLDAKEHVYVRQAAIRVLGDIGDQQSADLLAPFLDDADINLCTETLSAIARLKKDGALAQIRRYAASDDFRKRLAAASACAFVDSSSRLDLLDKLASDATPSVRGTAYELLFSADSGVIRDKYLTQALADSDMQPVILACLRISADRLRNFLPNVCTVYEHATGATGRDIKLSVLESLAEFGDSLTPDARITTIVNSALADEDYAICKRAITLASNLKMPITPRTDHYQTAITPELYRMLYAGGLPNPIAEIKTAKGTIRIELLRSAAPKTVANFIKLAKSGYYNNRVWHRVVPDFVIQDGCPRGDGWGGPGYEIRCEYNDLPYNTGAVGMATSGKDTGGSQYFICQSPQPHLNGRYTLFGNVIEGMDVAEKIEIGDLIKSIKIIEPKE